MKKAFLFLTLSTCISINQLAAQSTPETKPAEAESKTPAQNDDAIFEKVEVEASVNMQSWRKHLEGNLAYYIENATRRNMKAGVYTVNVRFLVEKDGSISDVKALNDPGYGLAKGAVSVVRTGPKWTASELNGKKVRSYHTQPIAFIIQKQKQIEEETN